MELKREDHEPAPRVAVPLKWESLLHTRPSALCILAQPLVEELQTKSSVLHTLDTLPTSHEEWRSALEDKKNLSLVVIQADDPFNRELLSFGLPLLCQSLRRGGYLILTTVPHDPKVTRRQVQTHLVNLCAVLGLRLKNDHFELGATDNHHLPPGFLMQRRDPWEELINAT